MAGCTWACNPCAAWGADRIASVYWLPGATFSGLCAYSDTCGHTPIHTLVHKQEYRQKVPQSLEVNRHLGTQSICPKLSEVFTGGSCGSWNWPRWCAPESQFSLAGIASPMDGRAGKCLQAQGDLVSLLCTTRVGLVSTCTWKASNSSGAGTTPWVGVSSQETDRWH